MVEGCDEDEVAIEASDNNALVVEGCKGKVLVLEGCEEEFVGLADDVGLPEGVPVVLVTGEGLALGFALLVETVGLLVSMTVVGVWLAVEGGLLVVGDGLLVDVVGKALLILELLARLLEDGLRAATV